MNEGRGDALLRLVEWQCGFGARYPGAPGHRPFVDALRTALQAGGLEDVLSQDFHIDFMGGSPLCTNLIAVKKAAGTPARGPLLIGAHFDSRARADNEPDPADRDKPIPGANDGGSGVAVILSLLPWIASASFTRDLHLVLFDAEDAGNIDGLEFAEGARYLAAHPLPAAPAEVLVLDLVGGEGMVFDLDLHVLENEKSLAWARELAALAADVKFQPLLAPKPQKYKYIIADHHPFHERGIPAFVLIDIDFPEWHTLADAPGAVSGESLAMVEDYLKALLGKWRVGGGKQQMTRMGHR